MNRSIFFVLISAFIVFSCAKEKSEKTTGDIQIQSLTATFLTVKAWDTTLITMDATGSNLKYAWEANHGDFKGSGKTVKYAAGECCVGLNTITCRVFNDTGEASDTIMIRVKTHYGH
ncbi:MAG: hypothetical protein NTW16_01900 [Bacteroidetes bacterium]|nr:hypothetical protein [Bacteroidota bacterium]